MISRVRYLIRSLALEVGSQNTGSKLIDTWRGSSVTNLPGHDPRGNRSSLSQICSRAELMKRVEACSSRKFTGRILGIGESFRLMPAEASFLAIVPADLHPNKKEEERIR